jgi:hypothetical protein
MLGCWGGASGRCVSRSEVDAGRKSHSILIEGVVPAKGHWTDFEIESAVAAFENS